MRYVSLWFVFICSFGWSQSLETEFLDKSALKVDQLVAIDNFGTSFYVINNELSKKNNRETINYSNVQLGPLQSVDVLNPMKMNLFYDDFNTVVILDNRLAEISKVDFNALQPFRLVTHVSTGNDNNIWIYNQNTNQLELFDFLNRKTKINTLPIEGEVLDISSNFYGCWVLTDQYLYAYNYVGSLTLKQANQGFTAIKEQDENLLLYKDKSLFYLPKNSSEILAVDIPELLISRFFVTDETLYIYDGEILHRYQIKSN